MVLPTNNDFGSWHAVLRTVSGSSPAEEGTQTMMQPMMLMPRMLLAGIAHANGTKTRPRIYQQLLKIDICPSI